MQTREQTKNWKVVASVATVAALGVSGLAVASPNEPSDTPPAIEIDDRREDRGVRFTSTTSPDFEVVPGPSYTLDDSLDSPLASANLDSPDLTDDSSDVVSQDDSPDDSPDVVSEDDSPDVSDDDSPDVSDDDSPDVSDDDSPDVVSEDDSADVSEDDSPDVSEDDSLDSLDS